MNWKQINLLLAFLAILMLTPSATAQPDDADWLKWEPKTGIPIRQGWHVEWFRGGERRDVGDFAGEVAFVWSDTRFTDRGIYLQVIDEDGNLKYDYDEYDGFGVKIADGPNRQEDPAVWPAEEDGAWYIAWVDFAADTLGDIYCTKVDADGNRLWAVDEEIGVPVCVMGNTFQKEIRLVEDNGGGCIIAWKDLRGGDTGDIYAMHITSNGEPDPNWPRNGRVVVAERGAQTQHTADSDGQGGMIIGWQDGRDDRDYNIWAQRIDYRGELLWGDDDEGVIVCNDQSLQKTPKLCPDGAGGAYFSWVDLRNFDISGWDIYVQRVNANGSPLWGEGGGAMLCDVEEEQTGNRIVKSQGGAAIVLWEDKRNDADTYDIYSMRISGVNEMHKEWRDYLDGVAVVVEERNQQQARLYPDGFGGAYYIWEDERDGSYPEIDIWAQRINRNGQLMWDEENWGVPVCTAPGTQQLPLIRATAEVGCVIAWEDQRNGSKTIFAQRLDGNGRPQWDVDGIAILDSIGANAQYIQLISRLDGSFVLLWSDGRRGGKGTIPYIQYCIDADTYVEIMLQNDGFPALMGTQGGGGVADMTLDDEDGVFIVWEDHRIGDDAYSIYAQHLDGEGEMLWGESGLLISEESPDYEKVNPKVCSDGNGGIFVAWESDTDEEVVNLFMQHVTGNGELSWEDETRVTLHDMAETIKDLIWDGEEGAVLLWEVNNRDGDSEQDIWALRINSQREFLWGDEESGGIVICDERLDQTDPVISLHPDGFIVVWIDGRDDEEGQSQNDIVGQFINPDGSFRWCHNGAMICDFSEHQTSPSIAIDNESHIWVTWVDNRYGETSRRQDIYIQKISCQPTQNFRVITLLEGENQGALYGVAVCSANADQINPQLVHDNNNNGVWVIWEDYRNGVNSDVYATHLDTDGQPYIDGGWGENGRVICDAYHNQEYPKAARLHANGVSGIVAAWVDKRATGKDHLFNIFVQRIDDGETSVGFPDPEVIPVGYALEEAYPNPFNSRTTINFVIPEEQLVTLALYDITGRLVRKSSEGLFDAGTHQATINADKLPAGLYIVRLEAGGVKLERKIHLIK
ncbi:T9SS type A sorting domain-containing protein [bacterium]|nr:T9SS type A sorting domain-containing protein [bacterium]